METQTRPPGGCFLETVKKASQSLRPQARKNCNPFSPAICASGRTLLGPPVWGSAACGGQTLRAEGRIPLTKAASATFMTRKQARLQTQAGLFAARSGYFSWKEAHSVPLQLVGELSQQPTLMRFREQ